MPGAETRGPLLGCIADDLTGATDLASMLVSGGMRTIQVIGVPPANQPLPKADAIVVALKSRTIPAAEAVKQSLAAFEALKQAGTLQYFFKYCSTFDSTDAGNIGPVADALLAALEAKFTIACPAFPENGRTIYQGHLFVGRQLLSDSSMRHHPLTPMTDSNLVRVLGRQTRARVGLVPLSVVRDGAEKISQALWRLAVDDGTTYAVVDATEDRDLREIGAACAELALITGGSGIALGLPEDFRRRGLLEPTDDPYKLPTIGGSAAVVAGSCSAATLTQIEAFAKSHAALKLDPVALADGTASVAAVLEWAKPRLAAGPLLIYASAPPADVAAAQAKLGRERASALVEQALAEIAAGLVAAGVRRLVVAGGETAGAVVQRLGVTTLQIGAPIDPGVPWTFSLGEPRLALALKSGNFGGEDFFEEAFRLLR